MLKFLNDTETRVHDQSLEKKGYLIGVKGSVYKRHSWSTVIKAL